MAFDFPSSPSVGQAYGSYTWDGEKWVLTQLTTLIPSGSVMLFWQAAAPTGWTKLTTQNDKALRVVSGSGGVAAGTNSFSSVMAQTVVGNTTLTAAQIPYLTSAGSNTVTVYPGGDSSYQFPISYNGFGYVIGSGGSGYYFVNCGGQNVTYTYYMQAANNTSVGTNNTAGAAHNHPITMGIQYLDIILASKN